jgi:polysaccharide pyruvyl transferase WcaK-like protein
VRVTGKNGAGSKMKRHLLINWAGVNSGDDYLCEVILSHVMTREKITIIRMLSERPVFALGKEIQSSAWGPLFSALDSLKDFGRVYSELQLADRILLGGGDVIRPEFLSMLPLLLAVILNKNVSLVGVGIVAPEKLIWRVIYRIALNAVDVALVRDERSKALFNRFSTAPVNLAPDLVFAAANRIPATGCLGSERDSIVINLRSVTNHAYLEHLKIGKLEDDILCDTLARAISKCTALRVYRVVLLPMVDDSTLDGGYPDTESDLTILKKLRSLMPPAVRVEIISNRPRSINELSEIYRSAKVVIAMRLHAAIPALAWGIPVVTIPYASKVGDLRERFSNMHTIPVDDLLNGAVDQTARTIELATTRLGDPVSARAIGDEAERALVKILANDALKDTHKSKVSLVARRFISCLFVSAFVLKAGFNRVAARRRKTVEAM